MLTIENIDKIIDKWIVIKGKSFKIEKVIKTTSKYIIGLIGYATTFAPITLVLDREEGGNTYKLRKVGNGWVGIGLSIEDMENQRVFLHTLENYLNTL